MVENIEIFIGIAHIAGIFVGFEALISVTHQKEVGRIRGLVTVGLTTIIVSLIPIGLSVYGFSGLGASQFAVLAGSPTSLKVKAMSIWVSQNEDCSSPTLAQEYPAPVEKDLLNYPVLFQTSSLPEGTYKCIIFKMKDNMHHFVPIAI